MHILTIVMPNLTNGTGLTGDGLNRMVDNSSKREGALEPETSILIVDDNHQYAAVLTKILTHGFGYTNITKVDTTEDAYKMLSEHPEKFRLLFVDYRFPSGTTGGELLSRLNESNLMEDKVAFLITSEPTADNVKQAVQAGAFGVVAKPFDRGELAKQLDKAKRSIAGDKIESF